MSCSNAIAHWGGRGRPTTGQELSARQAGLSLNPADRIVVNINIHAIAMVVSSACSCQVPAYATFQTRPRALDHPVSGRLQSPNRDGLLAGCSKRCPRYTVGATVLLPRRYFYTTDGQRTSKSLHLLSYREQSTDGWIARGLATVLRQTSRAREFPAGFETLTEPAVSARTATLECLIC